MPSLFDVIKQAAPQLEGVKDALLAARDALVKAKEVAPDFAPELDDRIAALDSQLAAIEAVQVDETSLMNLVTTAAMELRKLPTEGLDPREHASGGF